MAPYLLEWKMRRKTSIDSRRHYTLCHKGGHEVRNSILLVWAQRSVFVSDFLHSNHLLTDVPHSQEQGWYCPHVDSHTHHTTASPRIVLLCTDRCHHFHHEDQSVDGRMAETWIWLRGGGGDIDCTYVARGGDELQRFVKMVMSFRWIARKFWTSRATVNSSEALRSADPVMPCFPVQFYST